MDTEHRSESEHWPSTEPTELDFSKIAEIELARVRSERQRLVNLLEAVDSRIAHLQALLSEGEPSGDPSPGNLHPQPGRPPKVKRRRANRNRQGPNGEPFADADAVVKLLTEANVPMHYRDIHRDLVSQGYHIGGQKGDANTLLSRFFNDGRLERVGAGTYAVKRSEDS